MTSSLGRLLRNSALFFLSSVVVRAANTVLFILISRRLGADEGGIYSLALTYALLFTQLSFWGMDQLLTREVAKDRSLAGRFTGSFILIRAALSTLFVLALILVVSRLDYRPLTSQVIFIIGLTIIPESLGNICQALFIAFERLKFAAAVDIVVGLMRLMGGGLALFIDGRVETVAVALLASSLIGLGLNLAIVYRSFPRPNWRPEWRFWLTHIKTTGSFALIGVFYIIEFQSDTLILSLMRTEREVGLYTAATTILFTLALLPYAFRTAIFPVMSRLYASASPKLPVVHEKSFKFLLTTSLPVAAGVTISANSIIRLLFGGDFAESVFILRIVIWTFVLLMINVPSARMMIVAGAQGASAVFQCVSMFLNIGLNLALIPTLGANGAALARIVSTCCFVTLSLAYTWLHLNRWNVLQVATHPVVGLGVMLGLGYLFYCAGDLLAACVGLAGYAAWIWLSGAVTRDERMMLARVLGRHVQTG